jgi:carbon-monoxide dehydrogenase small subunit
VRGAGIDALLGQALKHLDESRTEAAADLARKVIAQDRTSVLAWRILALAAEASGDLTGALSAYEEALTLDPEDTALLKGLARIALGLGMAPVAEAFSRRALAGNSDDTEAVCLLSRALTGQGQGDGAVEVLSAHLTERPESPEAWNALGLLIADRGDLASAQTFFDEALRLADRIAIMKDGMVEQCDTPERIVMAPATDYVAKFTSAVDRARVVHASAFASPANGREVTTVEGIAAADGTLHPLQQAFKDLHGLQCGFCTPGMLTTLVELLNDNPDPTEAEVRVAISGNLCRCTGYQAIVDATLAAAKTMRGTAAAGGVR